MRYHSLSILLELRAVGLRLSSRNLPLLEHGSALPFCWTLDPSLHGGECRADQHRKKQGRKQYGWPHGVGA